MEGTSSPEYQLRHFLDKMKNKTHLNSGDMHVNPFRKNYIIESFHVWFYNNAISNIFVIPYPSVYCCFLLLAHINIQNHLNRKAYNAGPNKITQIMNRLMRHPLVKVNMSTKAPSHSLYSPNISHTTYHHKDKRKKRETSIT
ncbi:hypothetical protein ACJX0J_007700 [Zea mays]